MTAARMQTERVISGELIEIGRRVYIRYALKNSIPWHVFVPEDRLELRS